MNSVKSHDGKSGHTRNFDKRDLFTAIVSIAAGIVTILSCLDAVSARIIIIPKLFWSHPYTFLLLFWLFISILVWFPKRSSKVKIGQTMRWFPRLPLLIVYIVVTILFISGGIVVYKKQNAPPIPLPEYRTPFSLINLLPISSACAATPKSNQVLSEMQLVTGLSSMQATRLKDTLIIEPDPAIVANLTAGKSAGNDDNQYKNKIISWLQARCSVVKKESWRLNIPENVDLIALRRNHGDIVVGLMPTAVEYQSLSEPDQDVIKQWIITYVGQWNPRLRLTIDNTGNSEDLTISGVEYDVTSLMKGRGKAASVLTMDFPCLGFELPYDTGKIVLSMTSQAGYIDVPHGKWQSIDIVFKPKREAPVAPGWKGILYVMTNRGEIKMGWLKIVTFNSRKGG